MTNLKLNICLSDIPKDKIHEAKNGKKYVNLTCIEKKEVGQYEETHFIAMSKKNKEEDTVYIGSAEPLFKKKEEKQEQGNAMPQSSSFDDDLPF